MGISVLQFVICSAAVGYLASVFASHLAASLVTGTGAPVVTTPNPSATVSVAVFFNRLFRYDKHHSCGCLASEAIGGSCTLHIVWRSKPIANSSVIYLSTLSGVISLFKVFFLFLNQFGSCDLHARKNKNQGLHTAVPPSFLLNYGPSAGWSYPVNTVVKSHNVNSTEIKSWIWKRSIVVLQVRYCFIWNCTVQLGSLSDCGLFGVVWALNG